MFDIVSNLIDHEWVSNYSGDQSYIYYICGILIALFFIWTLDTINKLIRAAIGRRS